MLQGKAVVLTGAGRGIGAACAKGVGRQGAMVVVNDIDADEAARTAQEVVLEGGTAIGYAGDVSNWEDAGRLIETCIATFGKIDGLVNNAALYHIGTVDKLDPTIARALVEVNVLGPIYCTAHAGKADDCARPGFHRERRFGRAHGHARDGNLWRHEGARSPQWSIPGHSSSPTAAYAVNALSPFGATNILGNSSRQLSERFGVAPDTMGQPTSSIEIQAPNANSPVVEYLLSDQAAQIHGQLVRIDNGGDSTLYPSGLVAALGQARSMGRSGGRASLCG